MKTALAMLAVAVFWIAAVLGFWGVVIWTAVHFIRKFW